MPNPFENPELFVPQSANSPSPTLDPPADHQFAPRVDPRVDQLSGEIGQLRGKLDQVIRHLKQQAAAQAAPQAAPQAGNSPDPQTPYVQVRPDRGYGTTAPRGKHVLRLPSAANAWPYAQGAMFFALILLVIYLSLRQPTDINPDANDMRAAYARSVEAIRNGSNTLATELRALATQARGSAMTNKELGDKLNESIGRAMLAAAEAPMKALDEIKPWNTDVVADRLESAADGFADVAKATERLKRP